VRNASKSTANGGGQSWREYFTGLSFGSIFEMPAPLFTSMIWSRKAQLARIRDLPGFLHLLFNSRAIRTHEIAASFLMIDAAIHRPRRMVWPELSCTARDRLRGDAVLVVVLLVCFARRIP